MLWTINHRWATPAFFVHATASWIRYSAVLFVLCLALGLWGGFCVAPPDAVQGEGFRLIYVHVPCAFFSLGLYSGMAVCAGLYLIWHLQLSLFIMRALASVGMLCSGLSLLTGSLWGKPMWGTFWLWDARLTSAFILFLLYVAFTVLDKVLESLPQRPFILSCFALLGMINIPIVHYSVQWWNTLHQGPTLLTLGLPKISWAMAWPLWIMLAALFFYSVMIVLLRSHTELRLYYKNARWAQGGGA